MSIFNQILTPVLYVYDLETNQFLGKASFDLSPDGEKNLLNWVNHGAALTSVPVFNLSFAPAPGYIPPTGMETPKRKGVFRAFLVMDKMGRGVPIEMQGTFSAKMRSDGYSKQLYTSSLEFQNIQIDFLRETAH